MLIYIRFSYNEQEQRALLLFCTNSDTTDWRRMHYLVAKDKAQSPEDQTAGWCAEFAWRRSLGIFSLSLSGGGLCEFSILIPECNRASPCLENRWGIEVRSITPLWTVRPFYMWLSPSCSPVGTMKKEGVESFQSTRDTLVYEASWWFSDHINVGWRSLSLKGKFICTLKNSLTCILGAVCIGFAPAVYARNICSSLYGKII